jgi:ATP-dependent DNA helicase PIF1
VLSLGLKPKPLEIPVRAPACLYIHRVSMGQLGMKFLKFKQYAWQRVERTLQVTISVGSAEDVGALAELSKMVDKVLSKGRGGKSAPSVARRPLATRPINSSFSGGSAFAIAGRAQPQATASDREDLPDLSPEQQRALDAVTAGKSIFFTGCAGTGKSLLLRHIIRALPPDTTYVTGTTGLAGSLLGGTTVNAFAGTGRADGLGADFEAVVRSAGRGDSGLRWRRASALLIDEMSMMSGQFFDLLEAVARRVRGNNRPFGGIQLILCGDFHQLPPVSKDPATRRFAFEAESWGRCVRASVQLTRVFRQRDGDFIDILAQIRSGAIPEASLRSLLARCSAPLDLDDGIRPTQLFTHRADVDAINQRELADLPGDAVVFNALDTGNSDALAAACPAPRTLRLKLGAQVMLNRNISARQGLVNGARGVVERFTPGGMPVVRFAASDAAITISRERWTVRVGGQEAASRAQVPLALAWAVTVHKSQGLTLDRVEVSLDRAFEAGMAYVALSRARSLEGLRIVGGVAGAALRADPKVVDFYSKLAAE